MQSVFEKIIEKLDKERSIFVEWNVAMNKAIEIVKQAEAEYKDGWIPCSERLPEEELKNAKNKRGENAVFPVLATIKKIHQFTGEKYTIVSRAFYGCYNDKKFYNSCCDKLDVIAWQPLPEPYKPEMSKKG